MVRVTPRWGKPPGYCKCNSPAPRSRRIPRHQAADIDCARRQSVGHGAHVGLVSHHAGTGTMIGPILVLAGHAARQGAPRDVVPVSTTRGLGAMAMPP
jgi:hypothetical protein